MKNKPLYIGLDVHKNTNEVALLLMQTETDNPHARVFLVESAQQYKNTPKISRDLSQRQRNVPKAIREIT